MYSFFVLGQIPGTNIIISFTMWMEAAALLFALGCLFAVVHKRRILNNVLAPTIGSDETSVLQPLTESAA